MKEKILESLQEAILNYDSTKAREWAVKSVEENIDPLEASNAMTEAIRVIGKKFGTGELFLPDLSGAAEAMEAAMPVINEAIDNQSKEKPSIGTVVLGTVRGDIHDIGKKLVATMLRTEGFEVIDIGVDCNSKEFVDEIEKHDANILAMSALMTTTASEQKKVIKTLEERKLREKVKVLIGGAATSQDFADEIGADGYGPTATEAPVIARQLVESQRSST